MGAKQQGADATAGRWMTIPRTLTFVQHASDVLLMKRAAHKRVFPNQYNGLGGHIERHEDPLSSARREILEESGLEVSNLSLRAIHHIDAGESSGIMLFVFTAISPTRDFTSDTSEGTLEWVPIERLNEYDLVEDLPLILPRILSMQEQDAPQFAHVSYDDTDIIRIRYGDTD